MRELTEGGQIVGHPLLLGEAVGELGEDARRHRDVAALDLDSGGVGEGADDRQKGVGRQQRRLVSQRVDDRRLLVAHVMSPGVGVGYQYRVGYEPTRAYIWGHLPHATRGTRRQNHVIITRWHP